MAMPGDRALILIPSFNDWAALRLLLPRLDLVMAKIPHWQVSVLVVDDASTEPLPQDWPGGGFHALGEVARLHLRCNLSHQRAIALGLYHAYEFTDAQAVIVMDADGEDRAEDVRALLDEFERGGRREAVFAARTKRMEGLGFQFSYQAYKLVHWLLTGIEVRVGNFSVLPREALTRLMGVSDLWNHYAAAVYRARLPRRLVPVARGTRLAGESKMNFVSLLIHGLAAMSVFSDRIAARLLAASAGLAGAGLAMIAWMGMTWIAAGVLVLAAQSLTFAALFALTIVGRRSAMNFLPLRDSPHFILSKTICDGAGNARSAAESSLQGLGNVLAREESSAEAVQA